MKLFKSGLLIIIATTTLVLQIAMMPMLASAAPCPNDKFLGLPAWYSYLDCETDSTGRLSPTIENSADALPIGIAILEAMLRLGGLVAVVMVVVGGFRFITSQGSPEAGAAARKTVINALVGLVIVIISTGVVSYLGNRISNQSTPAVQSGGGPN